METGSPFYNKKRLSPDYVRSRIAKKRPLHKRGGLRDSWYQVYVKKKLFLCFDPRACKDIKVKGGDNLLDGHGCLEGYHSIDKLGSEG